MKPRAFAFLSARIELIELRQAMTRAGEVADLIELRLDYLQGDELFKALSNLPVAD